MDEPRKMVCNRCGKFAPISEIRYIPKGSDGKQALCKDCRSREKTPATASIGIKTSSPNPSSALSKKSGGSQSSKIEFYCGRCKYKFKKDKSETPNCPYCGRHEGVIKAETQSADALLKDSIDDRYSR